MVAALPGDELAPDAALVSTRAVTINAPPEAVWPWVAQLGQGRGGFYSYTWIENLIGCAIVNADQFEPAWQSPQPGDLVKMSPDAARPPTSSPRSSPAAPSPSGTTSALTLRRPGATAGSS